MTYSDEAAPTGYRWAWVPSIEVPSINRWEVVAPADSRPCRYTVGPNNRSCKKPSVARSNRSNDSTPRWWHYCENHLFGRRIVGNAVHCQIAVPVDPPHPLEAL